MTPRWEAALAALALAVFGLAQAVYWQAGEATYRDLLPGGDVAAHRQTLAYVLDLAPEPAPAFDADERSHLADVRGVFRGLRVASILAGVALLGLVARARMRRRSLRLIRDGAVLAGAATLALGVVAAVAFEPAFLAFHYLFFPQGNFLFDPVTSNLLRVYPQSYWYGVTLRVGATFIVVMAVIAGAAWMAMRPRGAR
jgi:integral membrane protein (TIGR01906 family)